LAGWGGDMMGTAPRLLPRQYTDDSIIPAIITNITPRSTPCPATEVDDVNGGKRRKSFAKMFKGDKDKGGGKPITKVVFMPRREYIKYFAKDNDGRYIGTEPAKQWTEEELDEMFAQYKPEPTKMARPSG
jgi:hypothetical protein